MAEYRVKGGGTLSEDEIERLGEACERVGYPSEPGELIVRRREGQRSPTSFW